MALFLYHQSNIIFHAKKSKITNKVVDNEVLECTQVKPLCLQVKLMYYIVYLEIIQDVFQYNNNGQ